MREEQTAKLADNADFLAVVHFWGRESNSHFHRDNRLKLTDFDKGMTAFHSVYGLRLSANAAVPGLPVLSDLDGIADIQIWLKEAESPLSAAISPSEIFYVSQTND